MRPPLRPATGTSGPCVTLGSCPTRRCRLAHGLHRARRRTRRGKRRRGDRLATSKDLYHWTLEPPVFTGGFGHLEVPQVFEIQGLVLPFLCCGPGELSRAERETWGEPPPRVPTISSPIIPAAPGSVRRALSGQRQPGNRYAGRMLEHEGWKLLGFSRGEPGHFIGEITDPDPVVVDAGGLLRLLLPARPEEDRP